MMQKDAFPVNGDFSTYLKQYGRDIEIPLLYTDLINYSYADAVKDKKGKWTHWENAVYESAQLQFLRSRLIKTYFILKRLPATSIETQFIIDRIDFCAYGNSVPFRIKIVDSNSGQQDFFYIKLADASRLYGLELEHLLSYNPINFLCHQNTLVEEHIEGIPGDIFLLQNQQMTGIEKIALANAFVQFNESCFARLLGDMRSYNFVVNAISFDSQSHFRIRAIDFDQQCYEGRKNFYLPQFYKENNSYVEMVLEHLSATAIEQQQQVQFATMATRIATHRRQLMELLNSMIKDDISENYKIQVLRNELNDHFKTIRFSGCNTMGAIVKQQLKQLLQKHAQLLNLS